MLGCFVVGEGVGGLEVVEIGYYYVYQDQVGQFGFGGFDFGCVIGGGQDLVFEFFDDVLYF